MIVGTAGHVDHGKTSLVRALTGIDTDRLAEEQARGISIELGFAYASFGVDVEPIGIVDVPGHRRFVQTMIAGAAGIDVGLLVVAADDGPMPQTIEHLSILEWLGVARLVVAISKIDVVDDARLAAAKREVEALTATMSIQVSAVVAVSTHDGRGVDDLKVALVACRDATVASAAADRRFRLAIDRSFTLQGIGLVVTGTCFAGRIAVDDAVTLLPGGLVARVRGIRAQNAAVDVAHAGQRVALNLVGRGVDKTTVARGAWAVDAALAHESDRVDVVLSAEADSTDERAWRDVRFCSGAAQRNARIAILGRVGDDAYAQVVFEAPLHLVVGDRFVLRDGGGELGSTSVAGGVVVDIDLPARGRRSEARLAWLHAAAMSDARDFLAQAIDTSAKGVDLARWNAARNTGFVAGEIDARAVGHVLHAHARWREMRDRLVDTLRAEHARAPDAVGPARDRLRRMALPAIDATTCAALLDELKQEHLVAQTGAWLHLPSHRVELGVDDRARFERMRPLLVANLRHPPRVRDVARELGEEEAAVRTTCIRLATLGELYRVAHDHFFVPDAVRALAAAAAAIVDADGVVRAAPFRDRIDVGRKVAIQILEFFDRVGYTRRIGDTHRVIQPSLFDT